GPGMDRGAAHLARPLDEGHALAEIGGLRGPFLAAWTRAHHHELEGLDVHRDGIVIASADAAGGYNARKMRSRLWPIAGPTLFVFSCTAVGVSLLLRPWSPAARPGFGLTASPFFRGFVSGLGLVHLAAAIADLRVLAGHLSEESPTETLPP